MALPVKERNMKMKQSKLKRLLSGITACAMMTGMMSVYQSDSMLTVLADEYQGDTGQENTDDMSQESTENNEPYTVKYTTTKFNLTGGTMSDENFVEENGICTLKSEDTPSIIPEPSPPINTDLVFWGWTNSENNLVTKFEPNTTYYANWKYETGSQTNSYSQLQYLNYGSGKFDVRGNGGNLGTTYGCGGYDLKCLVNNQDSGLRCDIGSSTVEADSGIYITPVMSFCNKFGRVSEVDSDNVYLKVSYIIQNRGSSEVSGVGVAGTADVMIDRNDYAQINGYSEDNTRLTAQNCNIYQNVSTVEMLDGYGNIYCINLLDNASCWWGYFNSRHSYAFSDHKFSDYSTPYDSGVAYSWKDIVLGAGESVTKSVMFSAGDIHMFRSHDFDRDGFCNGDGECELPQEHSDQSSVIYQPAVIEDNVYKISNAGQLMWIAQKINSGEVASDVSIELNNNISFGINSPSDGSCTATIPWIPIKEFSGTFNGNGYTISGLNYNSDTDTSEEENGGLFRTLSQATVENTGIINSVINGINKNTGIIAGEAKDNTVIKNVYSMASVSGNKSSGIVYSLNNSSVTDSYFAGTLTDSSYPVYAQSDTESSINNCYYMSDTPISSQTGAGNKSRLQFIKGEVAYLLGASWYQKLDDPDKNQYPVLTGENNVYRYTSNHSCSEVDPQPEIIYTNDSSLSGTTKKIDHDWQWGNLVKKATCTENEYWTKKCSKCGEETTEVFSRDENGHRAKGHNCDEQGYCTNINENDNTRCDYYKPPFSPVTVDETPEVIQEIEDTHPKRLDISGEMHVTEMTIDEIKEAGIDISGKDNYHYVNYSVEMKFEAEIVNFNKIDVTNDDGSLVNRIVEIVIPGNGPIRVEPSGTYIPEINCSVVYIPEQEMYMIIYGESKWLKEFYDVQLVVMNNDNAVLKNCETVLDVPDGLTLCNSPQTQILGDLQPNGVFDIHWYLRGDKAGDYNLKAKLTGENAGEEFEYQFTSRNTLHVYAGDALNMNIELPAYSFYNKPYTVKIALTNVSDKPVYNLQNKIKRVEHGYYTTKYFNHDGELIKKKEHTSLSGYSNVASVSVDTLNLGESAVVEVTIDDIWKSILEQNIETSKNLLDYLRFISSTAGSTTYTGLFINIFSTVASEMLSEISVAHVLKSVVVTTLEGSTTEIPYTITVTDIPSREKDSHSFSRISQITKDKIEEVYSNKSQMIDATDFNSQFIGFNYDADVASSENENTNNFINNRNVLIKDTVKKYDADTENNSDKLIVNEDFYFMYKTPDNDTTANVYIENVSQDSLQSENNVTSILQAVNQSENELPLDITPITNTTDEPFEMSVEAGQGEYNDGEYTVTGNTIFKINAKEEGKSAVIHIEYSDGYEIEYPIVSVEEHECSGDYVFFSPPENGKVGAAVQICSTCGKMIDVKQISSRYTCMLSNGQLFENIKDAVAYAAENNINGELAVFGKVHITEDIIIPDNISFLIAPNAKVTIDDSCSLSTSGKITDFGNIDGKCMVNILLNYWEGRIEPMQVPFRTEVTELPQIGTEKCPLGGWYCDSELTEPFESFVAGENVNSIIYYADIHHCFNNSGVCTQCGELRNGYDAFTKANVTAGGAIKINYVVRLSQKAASDNGAYMTFTFPDGSVKTQRVKSAKNNNDGTYTFSCKVDANRMSDKIISQIHYSGNKTGSLLEYSMKTYMDAILRNESSFDPAIVNAIKAMMNFGGYIQKYSNYNSDNLVNKDLNMPLDDQIVVIGDEYKAVNNGNCEKIKAVSAGLDVSSTVRINIKYRVAENVDINNYKFTIDGKRVTPVKSGDMYVVSLNAVSPEDYDNMYCFKVESLSNPSEWSTLDYSAFSYAKSIIKNNSDADIVNAMKALYNYNVSIEEIHSNN